MAVDADNNDITSGEKHIPEPEKGHETGNADSSACMKPDFTVLEIWRSQAAERNTGESAIQNGSQPTHKINKNLAERLRNANIQDAMNTLPSPIESDEDIPVVDNIPSAPVLSVIDEVSSQLEAHDVARQIVGTVSVSPVKGAAKPELKQDLSDKNDNVAELKDEVSEKDDTITPQFSSYQDRLNGDVDGISCMPCDRCILFTSKIHKLEESLDNMSNTEKCTKFVTLWRFIKTLVKDKQLPDRSDEPCKVCDLCLGICNSYHHYINSNFNFRLRMEIREDFAKVVRRLDPNTTVILNSSVCSINAENETNSINETPKKRLTIIPEPQPYKIPSSELETTTSDSSALDTSADINTIPIYETASKIETSSDSKYSGLMEEINKAINKEVQCLKEDITNRIIKSITPTQNNPKEVDKQAKISKPKHRKAPPSPLIFSSGLYPTPVLPMGSPSRPTKYDLLKQLPVADANRPYRLDHPLSNMNASPYPTARAPPTLSTAKSIDKNDDTLSNLTFGTNYENTEMNTFDCKFANVIDSVRKVGNTHCITDASTQCDTSLDSFSIANASTETEQTMSLCCVCKQWDPIEVSSPSYHSDSIDNNDGSDDSGARTDFTCHTAVVPRKLISKTKSKLASPKKIKLDLPRTLMKNSSTTFLMKDGGSLTPTTISNKSKSSTVITKSSLKNRSNDKRNNNTLRLLPKPVVTKSLHSTSPTCKKSNKEVTRIPDEKRKVVLRSDKVKQPIRTCGEKKSNFVNQENKNDQGLVSSQVISAKSKNMNERSLKVVPETKVSTTLKKPTKNTSNPNLKTQNSNTKANKPHSQIAVIKPTIQTKKIAPLNRSSVLVNKNNLSYKSGSTVHSSNYIKSVRQQESRNKNTEEWIRKLGTNRSNSGSKNHNSHGTDSGVCMSSKNTTTQPSSKTDAKTKLMSARSVEEHKLVKSQKLVVERRKTQKPTNLPIFRSKVPNYNKKDVTPSKVKVSFPKSSHSTSKARFK